jgi:hypothetical protein
MKINFDALSALRNIQVSLVSVLKSDEALRVELKARENIRGAFLLGFLSCSMR